LPFAKIVCSATVRVALNVTDFGEQVGVVEVDGFMSHSAVLLGCREHRINHGKSGLSQAATSRHASQRCAMLRGVESKNDEMSCKEKEAPKSL
jgi:hypothetical protein